MLLTPYYINKANEKLAFEDPLAILINQAKLLPKIEEVARNLVFLLWKYEE